MPKKSVDGKWTGYFRYGPEYPFKIQARIVHFLIDIHYGDRLVGGTCVDELTRELSIEPAIIDGVFENRIIRFVKKYPCLIGFDENYKRIIVPNEPPAEIQYEGKLYKRLISNRYYFKGRWRIIGSLLDSNGLRQEYSLGGTWSMKELK